MINWKKYNAMYPMSSLRYDVNETREIHRFHITVVVDDDEVLNCT